MSCACELAAHEPRLVVITGGPGAGKTALLEIVRRHFCRHVAVLPEAASVVFSGGFPRLRSDGARRAAQRAIFHVQRELEALALDELHPALALCDRGTLDGLAYWPGAPETFARELAIDPARELQRYAAVIHLRTPPDGHGYNHQNPLRIESALEAAAIDARIADVWRAHPCYFTVEHAAQFFDKVKRALELIRAQLPPCCRAHALAA